jgi:hypothetical protein
MARVDHGEVVREITRALDSRLNVMNKENRYTNQRNVGNSMRLCLYPFIKETTEVVELRAE